MSSKSNDQDEQSNSSSSNMMTDTSPISCVESPHFPSQQVPHLANILTILNCADDGYIYPYKDGNKPCLRIMEEPQQYFRFRYRSEMAGTHGCILGRSCVANKTRTHPSVELINYSGKARIRCRLVQSNNKDDHPHQLLENEEDRDVSADVGPDNGYLVRFAGMGIIHTAKKDVPLILYKKHLEFYKNRSLKFDSRMLKAECEHKAKSINLNIVRLKFTAHDIETDKEICPAEYSQLIHNLKSAATNDLKITRMSRLYGRVSGGEDIYILVEKVNRKNIEIRFVELCPNSGEVCWIGNGQFSQNDVHHQYAIVFRTPKYRNVQTPVDVKVYVELLRPSDGKTSDRLEFIYKADSCYRYSKKRKADSYSSIGSSSNTSMKSIELPLPVSKVNEKLGFQDKPNLQDINDIEMYLNLPGKPNYGIQVPPSNYHQNDELLGDALLNPVDSTITGNMTPLLSQGNVQIPEIQYDSAEIQKLLKGPPLRSDEMIQALEDFRNNSNWRDLYHLSNDDDPLFSFSNLNCELVADSAKNTSVKYPSSKIVSDSESTDLRKPKAKDIVSNTYSASYNAKDGAEVKELVKEICDIIRSKIGNKKEQLKRKLERLMDIRLSNGDTFLHMTVCKNNASNLDLINLIKTLGMTYLLNLQNKKLETALHLAVRNDMHHIIPFLIDKGCDPNIDDEKGKTAVHYAANNEPCMKSLLEAIKINKVKCNLNAQSNDKETALHLTVLYENDACTKLLLSHGANYKIKDSNGRTPLHIAVYDDCLAVLKILLTFMDSIDIDEIDGYGNTALHIICGKQLRQHSMDIVKLLLEKGANPLQRNKDMTPWKLAADKEEIQEILRKYIPEDIELKYEIKSEPEDENESADEGEFTNEGFPIYVNEIVKILDKSGKWRDLASLLNYSSLENWFEKMPSPSRMVLSHMQQCEQVLDSRKLAKKLQDIGETEAANTILKYIN